MLARAHASTPVCAVVSIFLARVVQVETVKISAVMIHQFQIFRSISGENKHVLKSENAIQVKREKMDKVVVLCGKFWDLEADISADEPANKL